MDRRETSRQRPIPNLFIVGAAKCGTTSLANALSRHLQIFMSVKKEPHYFVTKYKTLPLCGPGDKTDYISSEDEYLDLYRDGSDATYLLDASTEYLYYHACAEDIYRFNPDSRIIIMLRDPVQRAISSYKHLTRDSREKRPFDESLALEEWRIEHNWGVLWRYKDLGLYYEQVKHYLNVFGRERVQIIFLEDFNRNQEETIRSLLKWLDIKYEDITSKRKDNIGGVPSFSLKIARLLSGVPIIRKIGKAMISEKAYQRFVERNIQQVEISPETKNKLREFFTHDIQQLEKLLECDLSHWYK